MKRGILILIFTLLLACSVNAITVTFVSPANEGEFTDATFPDHISCNADWDEENADNLSSLTFYLYATTNLEGWGELETGFISTYSRPDIGDGVAVSMPMPPEIESDLLGQSHPDFTFLWNCLAVSNESIESWADPDSNRTFFLEASADYTLIFCDDVSNPNITIKEDSGTWVLDGNMSEDNNISCMQIMDNRPLTYTISSQTGSGGTFSLSNNDVLNFATDANATGTKVVIIKVDDGSSSTYVSAQVVVSAVNDAPYLKTIIPDQNWDKDKPKEIDLDTYFSDIEDSSLNYTYVSNPSSSHISVTIDNLTGNTTFIPQSSWTGTENVTFFAYDSGGLSATSNEVVLTVQEVNTTNATTNNPPIIDTISPTADPTISVGESQIFKITKHDPDGDAMNVTWWVNGVAREGETGDSFTYTAVTGDSSIPIKVTVSDGQASATNTWTLTVKSAQAANQTAPPAEKKTEENVTACGDDKCSDEEDQFSCCKDCGCPEGYTCNEDTDKCTKEKKVNNIILLAVVLGLFVGGAGVGLYIYKKKQEQEIFGGLANTPFSLPPKGGEIKREELIIKKPQEPVKKAEKPQEKPLKDTKTTSQVLLKNFIITNLKKGKTLDQIKEELHKVGWTDEQINDAYTAAQLDEAFS